MTACLAPRTRVALGVIPSNININRQQPLLVTPNNKPVLALSQQIQSRPTPPTAPSYPAILSTKNISTISTPNHINNMSPNSNNKKDLKYYAEEEGTKKYVGINDEIVRNSMRLGLGSRQLVSPHANSSNYSATDAGSQLPQDLQIQQKNNLHSSGGGGCATPGVISITRRSSNVETTPTKITTTLTTTTTTMTYNKPTVSTAVQATTPQADFQSHRDADMPLSRNENENPPHSASYSLFSSPLSSVNKLNMLKMSLPALLPTPIVPSVGTPQTPLKARSSVVIPSLSTLGSVWDTSTKLPSVPFSSFIPTERMNLKDSKVSKETSAMYCYGTQTAEVVPPSHHSSIVPTADFTSNHTGQSAHITTSERLQRHIVYSREELLSLRDVHYVPEGFNKRILEEISSLRESATGSPIPQMSKSLPSASPLLLTPSFHSPLSSSLRTPMNPSFVSPPQCSPIPMTTLSPTVPSIPPTPMSSSVTIPLYLRTPTHAKEQPTPANSPPGPVMSLFPGDGIEEDPARLQTRQKQIEYGIVTVGYHNYKKLATTVQPGDPLIPNKFQKCSKRSWDGQIRKWRRTLHFFDNVETIEDLKLARAAVLKAAAAEKEARQLFYREMNRLFNEDQWDFDEDFENDHPHPVTPWPKGSSL
ncbi:histone RNA hairpin-binding protein [Pelomyxa schiedti]|nr:histone RNA hairpin-binding protein [Pelomyxa schiedti]